MTTVTHIDRGSKPKEAVFEAGRTGGATGRKGRRARLSETLQSLEIYKELIITPRPHSVRELMDATSIADGTLYPALQKRVAAGFLDAGERAGVSVFELTPTGYAHARDALHRLHIDPGSWSRADRRYAGAGHSLP